MYYSIQILYSSCVQFSTLQRSFINFWLTCKKNFEQYVSIVLLVSTSVWLEKMHSRHQMSLVQLSYLLYYKIFFYFWLHSGPEKLKKSRQKNLWNCIFSSFKLFPSSKIDFWPFLKLQKIEFWQKKIIKLIFMNFFGLDFF